MITFCCSKSYFFSDFTICPMIRSNTRSGMEYFC